MLKLSICSDFDFESAEYHALFENANVTAFQHPAWHSAMQAHIHELPRIEERTLLLHHAHSGALVGVLPLIMRRKLHAIILEFANLDLVDYAMPVLLPDVADWLSQTVDLTEQLDHALGPYDMLRIKHLPNENEALQSLFPNSRMERAEFSAYATQLGTDYDAWRLEAISKSERKHRDKKRRAMMRNGNWQMKRLFDTKDIQVAFAYLQKFHKDRYADRPGYDMMQDEHAARFYIDLACSQAASGFVRIYQFTYNDEIVAVQYGIAYADRYLYLMMGVDYEKMGRYSPGLLMTEDIIRDCTRDGMSVVDLTIGDEPYKLKFGTEPIPIYTLWHTHSMLGNVGKTVAGIVKNHAISDRLRRLVR